MKINIKKTYFRIILLFPIATLFQNYFEPLNKILFSALLFFQILLFLNRITVNNVLVIFLMLCLFGYNVYITNGTPYNANELLYYPFTIIYLTYMASNFNSVIEYFKNDKFYILFIIKTWSFLVLISIFLKSNWVVSWGNTAYFGSFCKSIFRLAPTAVFVSILSICLIKVYNNKNYFYYLILPMFCFLMGGSRTYLFVGILLFIIGWYYFSASKKMFYLSLIPVSLILVLGIMNSTMMDKFAAVSYNKDSFFDFWGTLTNGRSVFWSADLNSFLNSAVSKKIFGNGLNYVYDINYKSISDLIWAHNDFIQCLLSHGILGLIIYCGTIFNIIKKSKIRNNGFLIFTLVVLVWCFNAFFNMFYTYFCSLLSYPFLLILISNIGNKEVFYEKNKNKRYSSSL